MYHIKQDQRSLTSAKMLQDGLYKCLTDKKYVDITISQLCEISYVSRTTFYRLFDEIDDLLQYTLDSLSDKAIEEMRPDENTTPKEYLQFYLSFIKENGRLYETAILSGRTEIMARSMLRIPKNRPVSKYDVDFSENEKDYLIAFIISTVTTLYKVNLLHGKKETPEDLWNILLKVIRSFDEGIV